MTPKTVQHLTLVAAAFARIVGMHAENMQRQRNGYAMAYVEENFMAEAEKLEQIAVEVLYP